MAALWFVLYVLIGLGVGVISGILGIGGGVILVPILIWCGLEYKKATGTSLAILVPPIGLPAAWKAYENGYIDFPAGISIACAFAVGAYFGRFLTEEINEDLFKIIFGIYLLFIGMRFILTGKDEVTLAVSGLAATTVAFIAYFLLYLLGRRHLSPPDLGQNIRSNRAAGMTDPDYYI